MKSADGQDLNLQPLFEIIRASLTEYTNKQSNARPEATNLNFEMVFVCQFCLRQHKAGLATFPLRVAPSSIMPELRSLSPQVDKRCWQDMLPILTDLHRPLTTPDLPIPPRQHKRLGCKVTFPTCVCRNCYMLLPFHRQTSIR